MNEWGFEKPEAAQALAFRMEKKRKAQLKKNQKQMTATERYEKFKYINRK